MAHGLSRFMQLFDLSVTRVVILVCHQSDSNKVEGEEVVMYKMCNCWNPRVFVREAPEGTCLYEVHGVFLDGEGKPVSVTDSPLEISGDDVLTILGSLDLMAQAVNDQEVVSKDEQMERGWYPLASVREPVVVPNESNLRVVISVSQPDVNSGPRINCSLHQVDLDEEGNVVYMNPDAFCPVTRSLIEMNQQLDCMRRACNHRLVVQNDWGRRYPETRQWAAA